MKSKRVDPDRLPSLALAYLGDAVYELMVRTLLVECGLKRVDSLHLEAVELVRAGSQAELFRSVEDWLTTKELRVMKRGRNAKSTHVPKSAAPIEYRQSTGLETLIGHWYLRGEEERLDKFFVELKKFYLQEE